MPWKPGVSSVVLVSELPSQRSIRFPSMTTASEPSNPNFAYVMPPSAVKTGAVADEDLVADRVGDLVVPRIGDRAAREPRRRAADLEVETGAPAAAPGDVLRRPDSRR